MPDTLTLKLGACSASTKGNMEKDIRQAKNVPEWSIVRLSDGRHGVIANEHYKRGKALVKLPSGLGVEISSTAEVEILMYSARGMYEYMLTAFSESAHNTVCTPTNGGLSQADNLSTPAAICG